MNSKDKYVVTDEYHVVATFNDWDECKTFANTLARENAIRDILENQVDSEEPEEDKISEWIAYRNSVDCHVMTDEEREEIEENIN